MNATQQSLRLTGPRVHISPIVGGGLLAAVLVIGALALLAVGVFVLFARDLGPTRSVAHVLHDVEHPAGEKP